MIKYLTKRGFRFSRQRGSHVILKSPDGRITVPVPNHNRLDRGTLRSILLIAEINIDEFIHEWN